QAINAKVEGDKQKILTQGNVSSEILKLAAQLNMSDKQVQAMIDKALHQDRGQSQLDKNIRTLEAKQTLENQRPYGG
ncbi:MAG TPA: hypothetical protein VIQ00_12345, partial [Chitinophagaceae bacterium]